VKRVLTALLLLMFVTVGLVACGSDSGSGGLQDADFNQQDADFASAMIPHHEQALQMASLAPERAANADVKALAARIEQAQAAEIDTMSRWLSDWGNRGATMPPHGIGHEAHGPGMADEQQLAQLEDAKGAEFDRLFLNLMIAHHEGAIDMAQQEIDNGRHEEARRLSQTIKDAQAREIAEMKALHGTLP
jgi:uncharacterized protein (DUF305 family)